MNVTIRTIQSSAAGPTTTIKIIDWNDSSDRKWLVNHLHWAMCNNTSINLNATTSYDRTIHRIASEGGFGLKTIAA